MRTINKSKRVLSERDRLIHEYAPLVEKIARRACVRLPLHTPPALMAAMVVAPCLRWVVMAAGTVAGGRVRGWVGSTFKFNPSPGLVGWVSKILISSLYYPPPHFDGGGPPYKEDPL